MKGKELFLQLADGVERAWRLNMNTILRVMETLGESPLEPGFWIKAGANGEQPTQGNLTPAKIRALVWAGLNDVSLEQAGELIAISMFPALVERFSQVFAEEMNVRQDPFSQPGPSRDSTSASAKPN